MDAKYEPIVQVNAPPVVNQAAMPLRAIIKDRPAFAHIEVQLDNQQKVLANGSAMNWMDG